MKQAALHALAVVLSTMPLLADPPAPAAPNPDALCVPATATVTVDRLTVEEGVIKAGGKWSVGGGAAGALIEMRLQSDRWQSETFQGTQGTWEFAQTFKWAKCGHYGFRVHIYPSMPFGGYLVHCLDNEVTAPWKFDVRCGATAEITHCDWECGDQAPDQCTGLCTGASHGGSPPYIAFWGVNDAGYKAAGPGSEGPWTEAVRCKLGDKISLKVRDLNGFGKFSPTVQLPCGAQPGTP